MRAILGPLLVISSLSFLQVQGSRTSPVNSTSRGRRLLKSDSTGMRSDSTDRIQLKSDSSDGSEFCDRDRGEILFMAQAVVLAKVRNAALHFQEQIPMLLISFCVFLSMREHQGEVSEGKGRRH